MRRAVVPVAAAAALLAVLAAAFLLDWHPGRSGREAFLYHCNEEGAGGMFTSREYCEELYARTKAQGAVRNSSRSAP
jgi:hypothetical protein